MHHIEGQRTMLRTKQDYLIKVYDSSGNVVSKRWVTQAVLPVRKAQKLVRSCSASSYKIINGNENDGKTSTTFGQLSLFESVK